ncbi:hypothetical protein ACWGKU_29425 [Kitasatospora sp. NPDC054768]
MFERLRKAVTDTVVEVKGHREFTRDIKAAVKSGDREAAEVFRTGSLAAALTTRGLDARGEEITTYVDKVIAADGSPDRVLWLRRR